MSLLKKYNIAGPRYTSYPTVPHWSQGLEVETYVFALKENLKIASNGLALYVHIPFCESLCTYCGCNTRITRNHAVSLPYLRTVLEEWNIYKKLLQQPLRLAELHLGGGTPTFFTAQELSLLCQGLLEGVDISDQSEFSVEVDPRVTSVDQLKVLYDFGFKRMSLGIQDFDPVVQKVVRREQSESQVGLLVNEARRIGYQSVNFDLIYGLPFQTQDSIKQTMQAVHRLGPDRIAFYSYAHVPWIKPSQRRFVESDLPDGEEKRKLYETGRYLLEEGHFVEIGMDHFALKTDFLYTASINKTLHRNFMGYTSQHVSPLIGLGVSAIGDAWTVFAQNEKLLESYQKKVSQGELPLFRGHQLTSEDLIIRRHILNLMTRFKTTLDFDFPQTPQILELLKPLEQDLIVKVSNTDVQLTDLGRAFLRNVCMAFDLKIQKTVPLNSPLYSKTI